MSTGLHCLEMRLFFKEYENVKNSVNPLSNLLFTLEINGPNDPNQNIQMNILCILKETALFIRSSILYFS